MPTYAYLCTACEHSFEQYQAFTDDSLTECPSCGQPQLRKVFNSIGVTFNGSGFYRTDSRAGSGAGSGSGSGSGSSSDGAKSTDASGTKKSTDASGAKPSNGAGSSSSSTSKPAPAATSTPA